MGVLAIWRYPVKAMLGELLDAALVTVSGLTGDRGWIVVDEDTGERIANKRGPTDPRLRACRAELVGEDELRITLPDGEHVEHRDAAPALSELLERRVRLEPGEHHDYGAVHVLTTGALDHLRRAAPGTDWDPRRFRANLLLEGEDEDNLIGRELRGRSGVRLRLDLHTPRCVVPTRAQHGLPADTRLLRSLVGHRLRDVPTLGPRPCMGAYASVPAAGRLGVGERLAVA